MANVLASQSLAAGATVTSSSTAWTNSDVIICSCVNGATPPNVGCRVTLNGSIDNTVFLPLEERPFGDAPNQTYYESFELSNYLGTGTTAAVLQRLNSSSAATFSNFTVTFGGNDTQPVTVAAVH